MRCPTLSELPPHPKEKSGWPWTEATPQLPDYMSNGIPWPRVSIVTPSYNQGQFIEETIRSVLLQGYPNLEYLIIDGGSDDDSVEIINTYEPWLAHCVSEPDKGQSHAINKGFKNASGEIVAWLNSDDQYLPETLRTIAESFRKYPEAGAYAGGCRRIDAKTKKTIWERLPPGLEFDEILRWREYYLPQPSCFLNRTGLMDAIYLDESLQLQMDYDLWLRIAKDFQIIPIDRMLSASLRHPRAKTVLRKNKNRALAEKWLIHGKYAPSQFVLDEIEQYLSKNPTVFAKDTTYRIYKRLFPKKFVD